MDVRLLKYFITVAREEMECGENGRHGLWYHMHRK